MRVATYDALFLVAIEEVYVVTGRAAVEFFVLLLLIVSTMHEHKTQKTD